MQSSTATYLTRVSPSAVEFNCISIAKLASCCDSFRFLVHLWRILSKCYESKLVRTVFRNGHHLGNLLKLSLLFSNIQDRVRRLSILSEMLLYSHSFTPRSLPLDKVSFLVFFHNQARKRVGERVRNNVICTVVCFRTTQYLLLNA